MAAMNPLLARWSPLIGPIVRILPRVVTAVLAVALGLEAARLVWLLVPEPATWEPAPPPPVAPSGAQRVDVQALANAALFGRFVAEAAPQMALDEAPDTTLNLTLLGIFAGTGPQDSRAIISTGGGQEAPYALGAEVVRGVKLEAIFPDRVILMRQGRPETLRLDKDAPPRALAAAAPQAAAAAPTLPGTIVLPQLASVREQILQDPSQAANYLRVQPATADGSMRGYRIYPGRDRSLFNAAGLRPGDLVTAINGTELNDATRALQMLTELSTASSVTLTVERGGNLQTVNISLN